MNKQIDSFKPIKDSFEGISKSIEQIKDSFEQKKFVGRIRKWVEQIYYTFGQINKFHEVNDSLERIS